MSKLYQGYPVVSTLSQDFSGSVSEDDSFTRVLLCERIEFRVGSLSRGRDALFQRLHPVRLSGHDHVAPRSHQAHSRLSERSQPWRGSLRARRLVRERMTRAA